MKQKSDGKEEDTVHGTGEDKVVVGEPNEDKSKASGIEGKTKDGDAEQKEAVDEAGVEDKISKDDAEKKDEAESGARDGSPERSMLITKGSHHRRYFFSLLRIFQVA
jgi:Ran-binding protein 3